MDKKNKYLWHTLLIAGVMLLLTISMKFFEDATSLFTLETIKYTIVTIIVWVSEYLILKGITNKTKLSISIVAGVEIVFDIINYVVRMARGSTITISDLSAVKTALSVSKNIHLNNVFIIPHFCPNFTKFKDSFIFKLIF